MFHSNNELTFTGHVHYAYVCLDVCICAYVCVWLDDIQLHKEIIIGPSVNLMTNSG